MAIFHSMKRSKLPSSGPVGDLYFCADSRETFVAIGDGRLVALEGLLSCKPIVEVGPQGEPGSVGPPGPRGLQGADGPQGRPGVNGAMGPKGHDGANGLIGATGKPGKDGKDGRDGADGKNGRDGQNGRDGKDGNVLIPNSDELSAAVISYRQKYARIQAAVLTEISNSKNLPASTRIHVQNVLKRIKREADL